MRMMIVLTVIWMAFSPPIPKEAPGWDRAPRPTPTAVLVYRAPVPAPSPTPGYAPQEARVTPEPTRVAQQAEPRQVVVAVIDTGVDCGHPALAGRCVEGRGFVDGQSSADTSDPPGHGTQVAGVIVARSNALIMPIRIVRFDPNDVAMAIRWASVNGARVINMSFAGDEDSPVVRSAVADACWKGVRIVAAAGNHGTNQVMFPAAYPCVIAVGALDNAGARAQTDSWSSGYGAHVDVWRLGVDIQTIAPTHDIGAGPIVMFSGTSAAAAVVAAELANQK